MADFMVGKKPGKDRYIVGYNESSQAKNAYKVGVAGSGPGQASKAVGEGQDPVVGGKSAFNYKEIDPKDVGDKSANMNFGGGSSVAKAPQELELVYSQKGSVDDMKSALGRRKAQADAIKKYAGGDNYDSPVPELKK